MLVAEQGPQEEVRVEGERLEQVLAGGIEVVREVERRLDPDPEDPALRGALLRGRCLRHGRRRLRFGDRCAALAAGRAATRREERRPDAERSERGLAPHAASIPRSPGRHLHRRGDSGCVSSLERGLQEECGYSHWAVLTVLDARKRAKLPLWAQIALSAGFTLLLFVFGASVAYVGGAWSGVSAGSTAFVVIVFLVVVPFLVYYAYPRRVRRWYHWVIFEACVVGGVTLPIPLVYLPWLIVTRRAWRDA